MSGKRIKWLEDAVAEGVADAFKELIAEEEEKQKQEEVKE